MEEEMILGVAMTITVTVMEYEETYMFDAMTDLLLEILQLMRQSP